MTMKISVLEGGEKFAIRTKSGNMVFFEVEDHQVRQVPREIAYAYKGDWTLNWPSTPPMLRVAFEAETLIDDKQLFWVGLRSEKEPAGQIIATHETAGWLMDTFGQTPEERRKH